MWRRIFAILVARNREFYRDRAGLLWNILMPVMMILAFAFIFGAGSQDQFKVGIIEGAQPEAGATAFLATRHLQFIPVTADAVAAAVDKVARHQLDLLLDLHDTPRYWVNPESARGYLVERLLLGAYADPLHGTSPGRPLDATVAAPARQTATGLALSYADWALPGILAMNLMFSSLWGVGWVLVRYRKNGVLRRLKATPLSAFEFLVAQVGSRLLVVLFSSLMVYLGALLILEVPMRGSYLALLLVYIAGALCMISIGLTIATRLRTEELADGLLNLISWPMLLLSGVWFSMEGTSTAAQTVSRFLPLTHLVDAARAIMLDGAGVVDSLPQIGLLLAIATLLLLIASALFRWD
ncbi:MAG: ABC transporter permease [Chromatiaceae bacterium]|nr:MAG: ABC transporter permease [Chromatiaceae bacterium]